MIYFTNVKEQLTLKNARKVNPGHLFTAVALLGLTHRKMLCYKTQILFRHYDILCLHGRKEKVKSFHEIVYYNTRVTPNCIWRTQRSLVLNVIWYSARYFALAILLTHLCVTIVYCTQFHQCFHLLCSLDFKTKIRM